MYGTNLCLNQWGGTDNANLYTCGNPAGPGETWNYGKVAPLQPFNKLCNNNNFGTCLWWGGSQLKAAWIGDPNAWQHYWTLLRMV